MKKFAQISTIAIPLGKLDIIDSKEFLDKVEEVYSELQTKDSELKEYLKESVLIWNNKDVQKKCNEMAQICNRLRQKIWKTGKEFLQSKYEEQQNKVVLEDLLKDELRNMVISLKKEKNYKTPNQVYKMKKEELIEWIKVANWKEFGDEEPSLKTKRLMLE